jgi:NRPS condensation-like uncharacterized protein
LSDDLTAVFRISATVKEPVKYSALREAVEITSKRFPYFSVSLGSGLFWYFLEFNNKPPRIQVEEEIPCAFAVTRKDELLYRVTARESRISVEFIHILTDGGGAMEYLKSLLYTYLKLAGYDNISPGDIILPETEISGEEYEDGYNRFFRKLPPPLKMLKAWHVPYRLNKKPRMRVIRAEVYSGEILEIARKHKVSLTEYLVSVYLLSLQKIYLEEKEKRKSQRHHVLRIEVPVNLRSKYPSRTMRNFSLYVLPELDMRLGIYTFEEILKSVHHQLQISSDIKQISRFLSSNVNYEKLYIVRILPLFLKKLAIASIYRGFASRRWTGIITNLGLITLPGEMQQLVDSFEIVPPPPNPKVKVSMAIVSYKDKMSICFCNLTQSNEIERMIIKHLTDEGIHVRIIYNN